MTDKEYKEYRSAITRNVSEVGQALLERKVLISFQEYEQQHGQGRALPWSFLSIAERSLYDCMLAHTMKVLDRHQGSATFWAIRDKCPSRMQKLSAYSDKEMEHLEDLAGKDKLKKIRDKTHFHIDRAAVVNPAGVYKAADIKRDELGRGLEYLWKILNELHQEVFGQKFLDLVTAYDSISKEVSDILDYARSRKFFRTAGQRPVQKSVR